MGKIDKCIGPEKANLTCENLRRMAISFPGKIDKCRYICETLKPAKDWATLKSAKELPDLTLWHIPLGLAGIRMGQL